MWRVSSSKLAVILLCKVRLQLCAHAYLHLVQEVRAVYSAVCDLLPASMSMSQSYTLESAVSGHHAYMSCWMPAIG